MTCDAGRAGDAGNVDLLGYDLATGTVFVVTANLANQFLQDLDGLRIVWTDDRDSQLDIFLCQLPEPPAVPSLSPGFLALLLLSLAACAVALARRGVSR